MATFTTHSQPAAAYYRWAALACGVLGVLLWVGVYLPRPDLFYDDAAQHTFWLYRYADPRLFPHDPAADYFGSLAVASWGYRGLYAVLAPLLDIVLAAKLVAFVLLAISLWLTWRVAVALRDDADRELRGLLAVAALLLLLPSTATDLFSPMGFQRTFALPITLLCVWALLARRHYGWVGVSWLLAAVIYPVILPVLGVTAALVFLIDLVRDRRLPPYWIANGVLGLLAIGLTLKSTAPPPGIAPTVTFAQAMAMPEFLPGGRLPLYAPARLVPNWFRDHHTGLGYSPYVVLAMFGAIGVLAWRRALRVLPVPVWALAAAGFGLWLLARLTMFALYLPNRHARTSLGVFAALVFAAALVALWQRVRDGEPGGPHAARGRIGAVLLAFAAPVAVAATLWPHAVQVAGTPVNADLERVYAYLGSLPVDTLVVAHPDLADLVPVRAKRSVLASTEESIPFHLGYYERLRPRIVASLRAAYATSWGDLEAVLKPYGASVVLTGPPVWAEQSYYPPFDGLVRQLRASGAARGFVLEHPPADRILFRSGEYCVVRVPAEGP